MRRADTVELVRLSVKGGAPPAQACAKVIVNGLTYRYETDHALPPVLDDIDLSIDAGKFVILTGPSGSGKTTLLTLIGALRRHQQGNLAVLGRDLNAMSDVEKTALRRDIGFIFQEHNLFDALTARETLQLAMQLRAPAYAAHEFGERPRQWLERVGLSGLADVLPGKLSTGQRQRVAIARALINVPSLILADEPTASLDPDSARITMEALQSAVHERNAALLMISHDQRQCAMADRVVTLIDGRIVSNQAQ